MLLAQQGALLTLSAAIMLTGCSKDAPTIAPRPDALEPFSTIIRDNQPEDAFATVYKAGENQLIWIGAKHATRTDSLTFSLIEGAYRAFNIDSLIIEGCPALWGPNPQRLIDYAREGAAAEKDGFQQRGEIILAVIGGLDNETTLHCAEPSDIDIKTALASQGFPPADLIGFYTMRTIPQWMRERRITNGADPALMPLLVEELERNRQRLDIDATVLPDAEAFLSWYQGINGKPLGADFVLEETGPLSDGPHGSNRIASAISRQRAVFLHHQVLDRLNSNESVMVVFGASHLMIHQPALDAAIGAPCYVGADLTRAAEQCR